MTNFSPEQFSDWLAKAVKKFPPNSKAGIISGEVAELSYEQGGKDKLQECCEWLRTKGLPNLADQLLSDLAPEPVDGKEEGDGRMA